MDLNHFIRNLALLANNAPQNLRVGSDGLTLKPIETKTARSGKICFPSRGRDAAIRYSFEASSVD